MPSQLLQRRRNAQAFRPLSVSAAATYAAALALSVVAPVGAKTSASPPITVNGSATDVVALNRDSSVFVPIRGVFDKLGATVTYAAPGSIVARRNGGDLVRLHLGSRETTVNGAERTESVAPFSSRGQVMVPLRLIGEAAGATVAYEPNPRAISVTRPIAAAAPQQIAQAAPAATTEASNATAADAQTQSQGIPWWVWLLAVIVIGALIWFFMNRRKKDSIITTTSSTRTSGDPDIKTRS